MELEELKIKWNKVDERLAATEVMNRKMEKELIEMRARSSYDYVWRTNIFNILIYIVIAIAVLPVIKTYFSVASLWVVVISLLIGLSFSVYSLWLLSRMKFDGAVSEQIRLASKHRRFYLLFNRKIGFLVGIGTIAVVLAIESAYSWQSILLIGGFILLSLLITYLPSKRFDEEMKNIEKELAELEM
jgi:hypothetical protein